MEQAHAAILGGGVLPVSHAGHGGANSTGEPDADRSISREVLVPVGSAQIEDSCQRPSSEWNVSQDRMEGMSEPGPVEKIANSPAGRAPSLVRSNDGALKPVGERFQPILTLEALDAASPSR